MPIEVHFESESLRKEFEKEKKLLSKHGSGRASLIKQRLAEFQAAACLEDLRHLPGHAFTSIPGCQEGRRLLCRSGPPLSPPVRSRP